jgi:hypothetical protein
MTSIDVLGVPSGGTLLKDQVCLKLGLCKKALIYPQDGITSLKEASFQFNK